MLCNALAGIGQRLIHLPSKRTDQHGCTGKQCRYLSHCRNAEVRAGLHGTIHSSQSLRTCARHNLDDTVCALVENLSARFVGQISAF